MNSVILLATLRAIAAGDDPKAALERFIVEVEKMSAAEGATAAKAAAVRARSRRAAFIAERTRLITKRLLGGL
jgi:hypothetical protein